MGYGPISGGVSSEPSSIDLTSVIGNEENGQAIYLMTAHLSADNSSYLLASNDGMKWSFIRRSKIGPGRDPSIMYHNDKYYVAVTSDPGGTQQFTIYVSDNISTWRTLCSPQLNTLGYLSYVWAPEWFVDDDGSVHIFVAAAQNGVSDFKIYEMHPTNQEFTTWSDPVAITGTDFRVNMIDPYVVKKNGRYYLFYKDDNTKYIEVLSSTSLLSGYSPEKQQDWAGFGSGLEGPCLVKINNTTWRIYMNQNIGLDSIDIWYSDSSDDWETWTTKQKIQTPIVVAHTTILKTNSLIVARNIFASYVQESGNSFASSIAEKQNDDSVAFLDEFNDNSLWWGWRAHAGNGSITEENGRLKLATTSGVDCNWWSKTMNNGAPMVAIGLPGTCFVIETKIAEFSAPINSFAGMIICQNINEGGTLKAWQFGIQNGAGDVILVGSNFGEEEPFLLFNTFPVWLRMRFSINDNASGLIYYDYSVDGINWTNFRAATPKNLNPAYPLMAGLIAKSWGACPLAEASYEYFKIYRPLGPR